jgi:acetylornithine deacetylase/succinyl-diaminopimelate desuccinylase-like protein
MPDEHPLVQAGQRALAALWGEPQPLGPWDFSTNGVYWAGKAGIPAIGLGPGDEKTAHTMNENVPWMTWCARRNGTPACRRPS